MSGTVGKSLLRGIAASIAFLALAAAGCSEVAFSDLFGPTPSDALRIATSWPRADRARLAREFAAWLRDHGDGEALADSVAWVETAQGEPIDRAARRLTPVPDVLLGGATTGYARLAAGEELESLSDGAPRPYWVVARRVAIDLPGGEPSRIALDDPRVSPAALAWCLGRADAEGWRAGYARLLDQYGSLAVPTGWRPGSAQAAVETGRADRSLLEGGAVAASYEEGAAIPRGARRSRAARAFLRFLVETQGAKDGPAFEGASAAGKSAAEEGLAADLLGATLVDAQDELKRAVAAVRAAGSPDWAVERLTQPPPWPPASIEKLLAREGEAGLALVETLIGQVAPESGSADWLARSWLKPRRDLDRGVLAEVAAAEQGRLAAEPRFRAWLRAEWTQWARQRYRWVARLAASSRGAASNVPPVASEP